MAKQQPHPYKEKKVTPWLAGLAAGLYPILFYYSSNFSLVNTWEHLGVFIALFIGIPVLLFYGLTAIFSFQKLKKFKKYLLPFLNLLVFFFLLKVCLYAGIQKKITLGIVIASGVLAFLLQKYFKKVVMLQLLLAVMALFSVVPKVYELVTYDMSWQKQPDAIEDVKLISKPNIYFIQPDGYVNFNELKKGYYGVDTNSLEAFSSSLGYKHYSNFRSNYASTLTSNSATFSMKHHYYNGSDNFSEGVKMRDVIMNENPVLKILKSNNYQTTFLAENYYLMLNRPTVGYDFTNINYNEVPYIGTGLGDTKDIQEAFKDFAFKNTGPQFYFIEFLMPSHIAGRKSVSKGVEVERELWLQRLETANDKLKQLMLTIQANDPNALVVIMADHGGFVGMEYAEQTYVKTQDRDLIYSIFSSNLLIKWPNNNPPQFDSQLQSSVNLFRVLFAHLSNNTSLLENLMPDESFVILNEGAPKGVYKYIDDAGTVVVEKIED